jgi:uncharacterized protein YdeI (YjbR/CyaY-like superfamily)
VTFSPPISFRSQAAFRRWLEKHHATTDELVVRLFKTHASDQGLGYAEALDEALCFGWIDGVRRALDTDSYTIRFTPRRSRSIWSRVNVAHVERLTRTGRMARAGLAAYAAREESRTGIYAFEQKATTLAPEFLRRFQDEKEAWEYFSSRAPYYQRTCSFWVMSAKREETREKRIAVLIDCSAQRLPIPQLRPTPKAKGSKPSR